MQKGVQFMQLWGEITLNGVQFMLSWRAITLRGIQFMRLGMPIRL